MSLLFLKVPLILYKKIKKELIKAELDYLSEDDLQELTRIITLLPVILFF